ncbi:hypothetical protein [Streptomyces goshikiensis]|uniref:hypothetical protein n=1 Tax=Streptomyces goshikiensis TaxID=1942 RepID=UPI00368B7B04
MNETTGAELAAKLLQGVEHEHVRAATRLLGSHRDGFWLRSFARTRSSRIWRAVP